MTVRLFFRGPACIFWVSPHLPQADALCQHPPLCASLIGNAEHSSKCLHM